VGDLKRAVASTGDSAALGEVALKSLALLQRADSEAAAKASFVATTTALGEWAASAGLASKLKGL